MSAYRANNPALQLRKHSEYGDRAGAVWLKVWTGEQWLLAICLFVCNVWYEIKWYLFSRFFSLPVVVVLSVRVDLAAFLHSPHHALYTSTSTSTSTYELDGTASRHHRRRVNRINHARPSHRPYAAAQTTNSSLSRDVVSMMLLWRLCHPADWRQHAEPLWCIQITCTQGHS